MANADSPIAKQFFIDASPPPGFALVSTIHRTFQDGEPAVIYARLFRVTE